jgi:hypothetical protein
MGPYANIARLPQLLQRSSTWVAANISREDAQQSRLNEFLYWCEGLEEGHPLEQDPICA